MVDEQTCIKHIERMLSEKRRIHSMNVAKCAVQIAKAYGADEEKAYIAGLIHDIAKEMDPQEQFALMAASNMPIDDTELNNQKLWHAMAGMVFVEEFVEKDEEILGAIRWHTTGKKNMNLLEKVIYVADVVSEERNFDGVEHIRDTLVEKGLNECMTECLKYSIKSLVDRSAIINLGTVQAYNEFMSKKNH